MLALFLISERMRGTESFWHPYIATLPKDADFYHMPFYWWVRVGITSIRVGVEAG